jgi:hypothetical protein
MGSSITEGISVLQVRFTGNKSSAGSRLGKVHRLPGFLPRFLCYILYNAGLTSFIKVNKVEYVVCTIVWPGLTLYYLFNGVIFECIICSFVCIIHWRLTPAIKPNDTLDYMSLQQLGYKQAAPIHPKQDYWGRSVSLQLKRL